MPAHGLLAAGAEPGGSPRREGVAGRSSAGRAAHGSAGGREAPIARPSLEGRRQRPAFVTGRRTAARAGRPRRLGRRGGGQVMAVLLDNFLAFSKLEKERTASDQVLYSA